MFPFATRRHLASPKKSNLTTTHLLKFTHMIFNKITTMVSSAKSPFHFQRIRQAVLVPLLTMAVGLTAFGNLEATTSPDTASDLIHSVRKLNYWLSGDSHAEGWRRFLRLNALDSQSARGAQADIATLQDISDRFHSGAVGLAHPRFAEVRDAIDRQIKSLSASQSQDLNQLLLESKGKFNRIDAVAMEQAKSKAVTEIEFLKRHYSRTMPSRERAELFHDLQIDQMLEAIKSTEFEMAPEVSVGKMDSMIREVKQKMDAIEVKLDALPFDPTPEDTDNQEAQKSDQEPSDRPSEDDKQESRKDLEKRQSELDSEIKKLRARRKTILAADGPRRTKRTATFRSLLGFESNFVNLSKTVGDPYFVSAASSYEHFVRTYVYGTSDNLQEEYLGKLGELEEQLARLGGPDSRDASGKIGDLLRWLENTSQGSDLAMAIRLRYSQPNAIVTVSAPLINEIAGQDINDASPVRQQALGRLVRGNQTTVGKVSIDLVHDPNQIHASIHLLGSVAIGSYIEQSGVQVFTESCGEIEARRSIFANLGGLYADAPYLAANFRAGFLGTSSRLRIVDRIASKQFAKVRTEAEGTAARQAEEQLSGQFLDRTNEPIQNGQKELATALKKGLDKSNLFPNVYLFSTFDRIVAVARKDSISTLAADSQPADFGVNPQISVRVHESMLTNFLEKTFAGKKFTDKELAEQISEMLGSEPKGLAGKSGDDQEEAEPFSITFANIRPIQIEFEDQGIAVVVSGRRFSQGDNDIREGLKIILRFRIKSENGKLKLTRNGNVDFAYPPGANRTPKLVTFRSFLNDRLNKDLEDSDTDTDLPDNLLPIDKVEILQDSPIAQRLQLLQFRSENGWLYIGWNLMPESGYAPNWVYDLPGIWNESSILQTESVITPAAGQ